MLGATLIAALVLPGASIAAPLQTGTPGVSILAQNGFGDHHNSMAWSMAWFKGKLYVGTGRDELCVENETSQFYFPASQAYTTNPSPNVHCPANPYDLSLQAQIWRYTPPSVTRGSSATKRSKGSKGSSANTGSGAWKMMYRSPVVANPLASGTSVARDFAYRGMVAWHDQHGRSALFAAAVTPDEYIPPLLTSHPPVLLRTFDGVHWQTLHLPAVQAQYPGGITNPMGFRSLVVWRGHLFVTATPDLTGDGSLFEVTNPWSDHPGLRQVSGPQYDIFEVQTFNGALYIGTGDKNVGYGVYRAFTYNPNGEFLFHPVISDGAGRGQVVTSVVSMHPYRGYLYVGASGWYNQGTLPVSEMVRIAPSGQWQLVVGNPRNLADGTTMYPVSGLYDGFFSPFAAHFWRMQDQAGGLYVSTNDWAYVIQEYKRYAWLTETALSGVLGFNLWATCDGDDWFAVTRDAFTGDEYNFGGRTLVTGGPGGQDLFIGTANQAQGTSIFDDRGQACGSLLGSNRRGLARPATLMSNSLSHGTLLSWKPVANAASYVVERASFEPITMGLKAPMTMPNGWQFDDAVPTVTDVGAPGSVTVTFSIPGAFTPVGMTTTPNFVDLTGGHYVYEVVAESGAGASSAPSNVEITPFAGPPATFAELGTTLPTVSATATTASLSASQRLLIAAEAASRRGDYGQARRDVARLAAGARGNPELASVAARVERRLQYATIAGAP